jgi:hypothetical protein
VPSEDRSIKWIRVMTGVGIMDLVGDPAFINWLCWLVGFFPSFAWNCSCLLGLPKVTVWHSCGRQRSYCVFYVVPSERRSIKWIRDRNGHHGPGGYDSLPRTCFCVVCQRSSVNLVIFRYSSESPAQLLRVTCGVQERVHWRVFMHGVLVLTLLCLLHPLLCVL